MRITPTKSIAIVGAGASGLYLAYRLKRAGFGNVRVFEARARIGGRMHDRKIAPDGAHIALGALSFSDAHPLVSGVCAQLGLAREPLEVVRAGYALRGVCCKAADTAALHARYHREAGSDGGDAYALLFGVVEAAAPRYREFWRNPEALWRYLGVCAPGGRSLAGWGFWNLIARYMAPEAYAFVRDCIGLTSSVANTQARAAIFTLLWETRPLQRHFRLRGGFSALAQHLRAATADAAGFCLEHRLEHVTTSEAGVVLGFRQRSGARISYAADAAILTCPPAALGAMRFEDSAISTILAQGCAQVRDVDASKLFLSFERPWWRRAATPATIEVFAAQAPLAQIFAESGAAGAPMLASFADGEAASFWRGLAHSSDGPASPSARAAAMTELERAFGASLTPPRSAWFIDWSRHGEGAAWHAWAIGADADWVAARVRQPQSAVPLFVCGEAFARPQGWVEGAFSSAEMVLERHFGMTRPSWVRGEFAFEV